MSTQRLLAMANCSKAKGSGYELEVVRQLTTFGLRSARVGHQAGMPGGTAHDIVAEIRGRNLRLECKRRADAWRELYVWLEQADILVMRSDRKQSLVAMPLALFLDLVGQADNVEG